MFSSLPLLTRHDWPSSSLLSTLESSLAGLLNATVSQGTWRGYATAMNHLTRCEEDTHIPMTLPLSQHQVLVYVSWLLTVRMVAADTVSHYLSGVRMAHLAAGFPFPDLRPPVVTMTIRGARHLADVKQASLGRPVRRAMTLPLMLILGHRIAESSLSEYRKQLVWTVALLALFGAFRVGELLTSEATTFTNVSLLAREVTLHTLDTPAGPVDLVRVFVKSPKVRIGVGDEIEVFALQSNLCPVQAVRRYIGLAEALPEFQTRPFFRRQSGANYTKNDFNKDLKSLLCKDINYEEGDSISAHSFRAAIASHMLQWGFAEADIQGWGRWSSQAYRRYTKLPVLARRRLAEQLHTCFQSQLLEAAPIYSI